MRAEELSFMLAVVLTPPVIAHEVARQVKAQGGMAVQTIGANNKYRSEMSVFVVWCRFHPKASATLMQHPRVLYWLGRHLYASSLKTENN